MTTDPFQDKLEAYVLGLLSEEEAGRIYQHVQTCPKCAVQLARLSEAERLMRQGFNQVPPAYLPAKVLANLKDRAQPKHPWLAWSVTGLVAAATVLLLVRIEPERIAKEQTMAALTQTQKQPQPAPASQAEVKIMDSKEIGKRARVGRAGKKLELKAPALPAFRAAGDSRRPEDLGELKNHFRAKEIDPGLKKAGQPPVEAVAPVAPENESEDRQAVFALPRREIAAESLPGHSQVLGPDAPTSSALRPESSHSERITSARKLASARTSLAESLSCAFSLAGSEGRIDPVQVRSVIARFAGQVTQEILRLGEPRSVTLQAALDAQGNVSSAAYTSRAFDSVELNQFILGQIRTTRFPFSPDGSPAVILVQIEVKPRR